MRVVAALLLANLVSRPRGICQTCSPAQPVELDPLACVQRLTVRIILFPDVPGFRLAEIGGQAGADAVSASAAADELAESLGSGGVNTLHRQARSQINSNQSTNLAADGGPAEVLSIGSAI